MSEAKRPPTSTPASPNEHQRSFSPQITPENWSLFAACRDIEDPDIFYPNNSNRGSSNEAVEICFSCPVRRYCDYVATQNMEKHGIWGGIKQDKRRQQNRERKLGQAATQSTS